MDASLSLVLEWKIEHKLNIQEWNLPSLIERVLIMKEREKERRGRTSESVLLSHTTNRDDAHSKNPIKHRRGRIRTLFYLY